MAKEVMPIEQAFEDLKAGKLILVTDDPDRENEGDLICAAEFATTENVNLRAEAVDKTRIELVRLKLLSA